MSSFKGIVLGICAASLVLGAVYILKPVGAAEKSIRFTFALIFLCITVIPSFKLLKKDFSHFTVNIQKNSDKSEEKLTEFYAEYLCNTVLSENGYAFEKIEIFTDKNNDSGIFIKNIRVISDGDAKGITDCILSVVEAGGVEVINE